MLSSASFRILPHHSFYSGVLLVYFFLPTVLYKVHAYEIMLSLAGAIEGQESLTTEWEASSHKTPKGNTQLS